VESNVHSKVYIIKSKNIVKTGLELNIRRSWRALQKRTCDVKYAAVPSLNRTEYEGYTVSTDSHPNVLS
jgi:hypothetical protein